jgi:hypothetical protein
LSRSRSTASLALKLEDFLALATDLRANSDLFQNAVIVAIVD